MKILVTGDWHITDKRPRSRLDEDYFATVFRKIKYIFSLAKKNECELILQPGDFFDSYRMPSYILSKLAATLLRNTNFIVVSIPGQHDLRYHNPDIENTPIGVLHSAVTINVGDCYIKDIGVHTAGWGEDIPEITTPDCFNILLTHRMVINKEKLWYDQTEFSWAKDLLNKYPEFDLIVSGDNHQSFTSHYKGRTLINCGSLMRSTIAQIDHKPVCHIFDTDTRKYSTFYIPIKPAKEVFNMEEAKKEKERNEEIESFIEGLQKDRKMEGLDFVSNMDIATKDVDSDILQIIRQCMEE